MVQHLHRDEIAQHMEQSGLVPSDKNWLREYQLAVNEVIKGLGGDDKASELYAEKAKAWNSSELPEELQRK